MINTTKDLILTKNFDAGELDALIREAIWYAIRVEAKHFGSVDGTPVMRNRQCERTFASFFVPEIELLRVFDLSFLAVACTISQTSHLQKMVIVPEIESLLKTPDTENFNGKRIKNIRGGLRTMLVWLWHRQILILPPWFYLERSLSDETKRELFSEVINLFCEYDVGSVTKPQNHPDLGSWDDSYFSGTGYRLYLSTDWHKFEQVNLDELAQIHLLHLKGSEWVPNIGLPFIPMMRELIKQHASRLNFTAEDINLYYKFINGGWFNDMTFPAYRQNHPELYREQRKQYGLRSTIKYKKEFVNRAGFELENGVDLTKPASHIIMGKIAGKGNHDAALEYYEKLTTIKAALYSTNSYPGREHVDVAKLCSLWHKIFADFMEFRSSRGAESEQDVASELKLLKDYLFCYLPWWCELNPQSSVSVPINPVDFARFEFWIGSTVDAAPLPFLEIVKLRRKTINSLGRTVSVVNQLFEYLAAHGDMYPELRGRIVKNPVVTGIDFPRGRRKPHKTTKVPISKQVLPFLLRYLYALEEFGMMLQEEALAEKLNFGLHSQPEVFHANHYNYASKFNYREKEYSINEVPNVFSFGRREINTKEGVKNLYVPHLTALRLLIVMLETGLRGQAVQWLDRRTWDTPNTGKPENLDVYTLHVNTDKTREKPWLAPLIHRARKILLREAAFQSSICETGKNNETPYESRANSRFAPVLPLFRTSGQQGRPVGDGVYTAIWTTILEMFQRFYNDAVQPDQYVQFVRLVPAYLNGFRGEGREKINIGTYSSGKNGEHRETVQYSVLRHQAIHTPHAMRASFISARAGVLDVEDIAAAVGHTSTYTTHYYTIENIDELAAKIALTDRRIWEPDEQPCQIRADHPESALRQNWRQNREECEKRFGFATVSLLNETDDNLQDAIKLLRTTPANQVVFRETHICPVGEICPSEISDIIIEPRRCGLCPYAVKSVDHAPAIAAKMRQLLEQAHTAAQILKDREKQNEPQALLDEINERRKLDILEYTAWHQALTVLSGALQNSTNAGEPEESFYTVGNPDAVKRHLKLVTKQCGQTEFILHRIWDVQTHPSMETPELKAKAGRLRRQMLANSGKIEEALQEIPEGTEIQNFLSSLNVVMKTFNLSLKEIIQRNLLENNQLSSALMSNKRLMLTANDN